MCSFLQYFLYNLTALSFSNKIAELFGIWHPFRLISFSEEMFIHDGSKAGILNENLRSGQQNFFPPEVRISLAL